MHPRQPSPGSRADDGLRPAFPPLPSSSSSSHQTAVAAPSSRLSNRLTRLLAPVPRKWTPVSLGSAAPPSRASSSSTADAAQARQPQHPPPQPLDTAADSEARLTTMKGIGKFVKRTPQLLGSRVGLSQKSTDAAFDDLNRRFTVIEKYADKLQKDSATYRDAVKNMLLSGGAFAEHFTNLFRPMGNEIDIERAHPEASQTIVNLAHFQQALDELRELLVPEVTLVESRILQPIAEFQAVMKTVRKNITKRDHKLVDFDRHNNTYSKLRDKKEKTLKDEQNMFKVEQDYETAAADYEQYNELMKEELPHFFEMATRFMTPLFHSFYYMQLNVLYLTLDALQKFADGKYDISAASVARVEEDYVAQLNDAAEKLEALSIRKPAMPTARVLQQARQSTSPTSSLSSKTGLGRASSMASAKVAPPAYSSGGGSAGAAATKRAPPPIPGKPATKAQTPIDHVIALYDYAAQADGDLTFSAGDRIEVVERSASAEDWWTGKLNGAQGVFPGNYVRDE